MADTHVISALSKKRAELLGEIEHYEKLIKEYKENLFTIDKTILIFEPDYDLSSIAPKVRRETAFARGEARLLAIEAIKEFSEPISTENIARYMAKKKNIDITLRKDRIAIQKTLSKVLGKLEDLNLIQRTGSINGNMMWQIKPLGN